MLLVVYWVAMLSRLLVGVLQTIHLIGLYDFCMIHMLDCQLLEHFLGYERLFLDAPW